MQINNRKPVLLLILDGWGHREETADNAIAQANAPHWAALLAGCPHTLIHTEGRHVGLPDGQMGNSEVGHMNIGAGRIVYQDLTRVDAAIEDGSFFGNAELVAACAAAKQSGGCLHVMGLLSPGGVHSHESHVFAMLNLAKQQGVESVQVHAFLDGRDMPPRSAMPSLERLEAVCQALGNARIATVSGRYYAMDRDQRWERVAVAYNVMVHAEATYAYASATQAVDAAYARNENDEFVSPSLIGAAQPVRDGDAFVFMNFRADRARQITTSLVSDNFDGFDRGTVPKLSRFVCLAEYSSEIKAPVAFASDSLQDTLTQVLAKHGRKQLRIAETEKYAHVTFFFSGGAEDLVAGEERILIPSPKVATYDLQPEMSLPELSEKLCAQIDSGKFDAIICNVANPDMVGHTGSLPAAIAAVEAVDKALGQVRSAIERAGGVMLVTADHGNLEMMRDPQTGQPHTAHTVGPVPFVACGVSGTLRAGGALRDVAPTILDLLGIERPAAMTGRSLLQKA